MPRPSRAAEASRLNHALREIKGVKTLCFGVSLQSTPVFSTKQRKSRCHDQVAPTKQADLIMPSITRICAPRFSIRTRTWLPLKKFCTKGWSGTRSSYSATQLMLNHDLVVLRPLLDGEMS